MPFLLAKILNFQGSAHLIGVGSFSKMFLGSIFILVNSDLGKAQGTLMSLQTVDKLGVGCYAQHHFSFKTSFLFIFFKINKNLAVFQPRFSRIFASFFKFMHAKVSPAFISIRAFPTYCVYRNPCCSFAVPKIRSMVSFLNW